MGRRGWRRDPWRTLLEQQRYLEDKDKEEEERETIQTLFSSDANAARALADLRFVLCALRKSLISAGRGKRELGLDPGEGTKEEGNTTLVHDRQFFLSNVQCTLYSQRRGPSRGWCARLAAIFCGNWPRWVTWDDGWFHMLNYHRTVRLIYLHLNSMFAESIIDKAKD